MNNQLIKTTQNVLVEPITIVRKERCYSIRQLTRKLLLNKAIKTILFTFMLVTFFVTASGQDKTQATILSVTDIHFNPYHDSLIVNQLIQTSYTHWDTVFSQIKDNKIASYHHETTPKLFELLLKSMGKEKEEVSAVLFTGDILGHDFNDLFYKYSGKTDEKEKNDFIYKTVGYVSMKFRQTFPTAPIYFSLGNNDSYMGDYAIVDNGSFLQNTTNLFYKNFINPNADTINTKNGEDDFRKSYSAHGYYNLEFPTIKNCRIIGLNTIFFSVNYSDTSSSHNPGNGELEWLEKQLSASEKAGEKVWLLLHIPSGVNVYSTEHNSTEQAIKVSLFWQKQYNDRYLKLMQRYHKTIVTSFAGHTHMDDFRLIYNQDTTNRLPLEFIHITPSVSPVFGNNPSFQIMEVDESTGTINETNTYYVDLSDADPDFKKEYKFTSTYNVYPDLTGLDSLYQMLLHNQEMLKNYVEFYPSSSAKSGISSSWKWYWGGIGNLTSEEYVKAYTKILED